MANKLVCDITGKELSNVSNCSSCNGGKPGHQTQIKDDGCNITIRPINSKDERGRHDIALCSDYFDKFVQWLQDEYKSNNPEEG